MTTADIFIRSYQFYRNRTLALLENIEQEANDPMTVLGWRPGPGRAHLAWQIMHIGVTEEIFATERLMPEKTACFTELWPRFRGGSTPDDEIPTLETIRQVLCEARVHLIDTLGHYGDDRLEEIPPPLAERGLSVLDVLYVIGWHEAHHHGQAHITYNLWRAAKS